jgi:hypothetical protein
MLVSRRDSPTLPKIEGSHEHHQDRNRRVAENFLVRDRFTRRRMRRDQPRQLGDDHCANDYPIADNTNGNNHGSDADADADAQSDPEADSQGDPEAGTAYDREDTEASAPHDQRRPGAKLRSGLPRRLPPRRDR